MQGRGDVAAHFDQLAPDYHEAHGRAEHLLASRLDVVRRLMAGAGRGTLLEIGCGTGIHALALAGEFGRVIGTDLSPAMVGVAQESAERSAWRDRVSFRVDPAEELASIEDGSVDVALCVGALEHILDRPAAVRQVRRVLRDDGVFVCLTPNGSYCWYRLAPLLGRDTRHLSTDQFLRPEQLRALLESAGLEIVTLEHWRFVPRGDLPRGFAPLLRAADAVGTALRIGGLRGGIAVAASPAAPSAT